MRLTVAQKLLFKQEKEEIHDSVRIDREKRVVIGAMPSFVSQDESDSYFFTNAYRQSYPYNYQGTKLKWPWFTKFDKLTADHFQMPRMYWFWPEVQYTWLYPEARPRCPYW